MTDAPYAGLRPFHTDEIDVFFGRETHIDQLLEKLDRSRFLGVVGTSGCGKSSLIKAGLIPALQTGFLTSAGARWRVAEMRPGDRPLERLADALLDDGALGPERAGHPLANALILASLRRGPLGLSEILNDTPLPEHTQLLLLVDQFEEIFRYHQHGDRDRADAFVALLLQAAKQPGLPVYVVLTMRSDFLGDCTLFDGLPEALNESQYLTPRLDREQRQSAIAGPASVFGASVEPRLVNRLLNDMGDEPDQLPLMQHLMMRLWNEAHDTGTKTLHGQHIALTVEGYEAVGGFANALSRHADEAFAELDNNQQHIAEVLFRTLSERSSDQRDTRRPARLGEIAAVAGNHVTANAVATVIDVFRAPDRSFLTPPAGAPLDADSIIDISHESLIRQWQRLRNWVDDEAASADIYRRLVETARLWQADQAGLWSAPDLDLALAWKQRQQPTATWAERYDGGYDLAMQFLAASERQRDDNLATAQQAERQVEQQRRTRQMSIILGCGLLVALALALVAFREQRRAQLQKRIAISGQLVSQAKENLDSNPQLSLLLAVEAMRTAPEAPSDSPGNRTRQLAPIEALRQALSLNGGSSLVGHTNAIRVLAVSPDGKWLASGSDDTTVRLWQFDDPTAEPIILNGHGEAVTALAISPDSRWLATGGHDDQVRFLDLLDPTAEPIVYQGHFDSITAITFGPDSRRFLTGSQDNTVHLYQLGAPQDQAEPIVLTGAADTITAVAISPDGRWLIAASDDNTTRVWSAAQPEAAPWLLEGHLGPVRTVAVSPNSRWLITGSFDNTARRWDLGGLRPGSEPPDSIVLAGHQSSVSALAISPDGQCLVTGSRDNTARLWNLPNLTEDASAMAVFTGHRGAVSALAISPDNQWLITASWDQTARLWNLKGTEPAASSTILRGHDAPLFALAINPTGNRLATASDDGTVRLWPLDDVNIDDTSIGLRGFRDTVSAVAYSPNGRWLATASEDNTARLWNLSVANLSVQPIILTGHQSSVNAAVISPDNRWLATASEDNTALLWNLEDALATGPIALRGHGNSIRALAVSPDSRWLATAGAGNVARLWDLQRADPSTQPIVLQGHQDSLTTIAISTDGTWLATGSQDHTVRTWDLESNPLGSELFTLSGHQGTITSLAIIPGSRQLVTGSRDRTTRLWDLATEDPNATVRVLAEFRDVVTTVAVSPDGSWLASGDAAGINRLWTLPDFSGPDVLTDHERAITAQAFAPDGSWLATASNDATVKLWDLTTRPVSIIGHLRGHAGPIVSLAVSPDGLTLATGSADDTARLWHRELWTLSKDALIELACRTAGRNLSPTEWAKYQTPELPYRETCPGLPGPGV